MPSPCPECLLNDGQTLSAKLVSSLTVLLGVGTKLRKIGHVERDCDGSRAECDVREQAMDEEWGRLE